MSFELIGIIALAVLGIAMYMKHRSKPVDMDHKAPNVHNVQMKGKVGPATAAEKPAPKAAAPKTKAAAAPKKKVVKKKTTKKKTTKKKTTKKS